MPHAGHVCPSPVLHGHNTAAPDFLATAGGTYTLQATASDGCASYQDAVVVHVGCHATPVAPSAVVVRVASPGPVASGARAATVLWDPVAQRFGAVVLEVVPATPNDDEGPAPVAGYSWSIASQPPLSTVAVWFGHEPSEHGGLTALHAPDVGGPGTQAWLVAPGGLSNGTAAFLPDVAGEFTLAVTASLGCGGGAHSNVTVTAACGAALAVEVLPAARVRAYASATTGSWPVVSVSLAVTRAGIGGSGADMPPGVHVAWRVVSVPPASRLGAVPVLASGAGVAAGSVDVRPDAAGTYALAAVVSDGCATSTTQVVVEAGCAQAPVVSAGPPAVALAGNQLMAHRMRDVSPLRVGLRGWVGGGGSSGEAAGAWDGVATVTGHGFAAPRYVYWRLVARPGDGDGPGEGECPSSAPPYGSSFFVNERLHCRRSRAVVHDAHNLTGAYFHPDRTGVFTFALTVLDACGGNHTAETSVHVRCNHAPIADAGRPCVRRGTRAATWLAAAAQCSHPRRVRAGVVASCTGGDVFATLGSFVRLSGVRSRDVDETDRHLVYQWAVVAHPAAATAADVALGSARARVASFTPSTAGVYRVRLNVSDGCSQASDTVSVVVSCNQQPVPKLAAPVQTLTPTHPPSPLATFPTAVIDASYSHDPDADVLRCDTCNRGP